MKVHPYLRKLAYEPQKGTTYPDHRKDLKDRSPKGVPLKYPLVVWRPKIGDLLESTF